MLLDGTPSTIVDGEPLTYTIFTSSLYLFLPTTFLVLYSTTDFILRRYYNYYVVIRILCFILMDSRTMYYFSTVVLVDFRGIPPGADLLMTAFL